MYAIVDINGKQYKVEEGKYISVDLIDQEPGSSIQLDQVLLVNNGSETKLGKPTVAGASVTATVRDHFKDPKILVFKMKKKKGYRRKQGHRQQYTRINIDKITA